MVTLNRETDKRTSCEQRGVKYQLALREPQLPSRLVLVACLLKSASLGFLWRWLLSHIQRQQQLILSTIARTSKADLF